MIYAIFKACLLIVPHHQFLFQHFSLSLLKTWEETFFITFYCPQLDPVLIMFYCPHVDQVFHLQQLFVISIKMLKYQSAQNNVDLKMIK